MNSSIEVPDMREIRIEVMGAILKNLGLAKSAMYLRENFSSKTDYLQIKEELFSNKGTEEIYNDILAWKKDKR
ncbi:MAG: hypothetical protein SFU98_10045 [Leptospiraceae bacterium]|nr:hypothetical protein [Leptospiraceae bacterium]